MEWTPPPDNNICVPKLEAHCNPRTGASIVTITTVGIDLAKNVFQVHGVDLQGKAQWSDKQLAPDAACPAQRECGCGSAGEQECTDRLGAADKESELLF
jgi:hypothetical protein